MKYFDTPVLFLIFNQPDKTKETFLKIREIKPRKLFIAADGPRPGNKVDTSECEEVRELVRSMIDWDCEVHERFQDKNLGCKLAVSSAISWFFEYSEEGIILEYDCVPSNSFFTFCEKMLERYRNENRVMSISGSNYQFGKVHGDGSYYYSKIPSVWGWATWKQSWEKWDGDIKDYPQSQKYKMVQRYFKSRKSNKFWNKKFLQVYNKIDTTWGLPWVFCLFANDGVSVTPNKNLVTNIGFSNKATHAVNEKDVHANMISSELNEFIAPSFKFPILEADEIFTHDLARLPIRLKFLEFIRSCFRYLLTVEKYQKVKKTYHLFSGLFKKR